MTEQERLDGHRAQAEEWLRHCFQGRAPRGDLYDAMYYSGESAAFCRGH